MNTEVKLDKSVEISAQAAMISLVLITAANSQPGFDAADFTRKVEESLEKMKKKGFDESLLSPVYTSLRAIKKPT
jgi:hypothetical protein